MMTFIPSGRAGKRVLGITFLVIFLGSCNNDAGSLRVNRIGPPGTQGQTYSPADLAGDWVGTLVPSNPLLQEYNFYVRCDGQGNAYEAANGVGNQWNLGNSVTGTTVSATGSVAINLQETLGMLATLELTGNFNIAADLITGSYAFYRNGAQIESGTFNLLLSTGPGHFSVAVQLAGSWSGDAASGLKSRPASLEIDSDGSILSGGAWLRVFDTSGLNTGVFQFSDDALGRLDNVVIHSTDGSMQTLIYAIVNDAGNLLTGQVRDSLLPVKGNLRLAR